ncbi:unnamed protein product [Triticum turgidum subsp. durum]|nr:unnamed protein product [Triticum turgidum subsp. durum]
MAARIMRLLHHHNRRLLATAAEATARRLPRAPLGGAIYKDVAKAEASSLKNSRWYMTKSSPSSPLTMQEYRKTFPSLIRSSASYSSQASDQNPKEGKKDLSTVGDPFDAPTYNIPEKPVTFAEGASYSVVILAGLGVAALAGYSVFKELIFEPKE